MRMNITLDVGSANDAFGPEYESPEDDGTRQREVCRILRDFAYEVRAGAFPLKPGHSLILRDANGNRVGVVDIFGGRS